MSEMNEELLPDNNPEETQLSGVTEVNGLYKNWFLDYASYVILERAVPLGAIFNISKASRAYISISNQI